MLERYHRAFVKAGARCRPAPGDGSRQSPSASPISPPNSTKTCCADEQAFLLVLDAGDLVRSARCAARAAAEIASARGLPGKYAHFAVALQHRAVPAVLRAARSARKGFQAWTSRGANGGKTDNRKLVAEILSCAPNGRGCSGFTKLRPRHSSSRWRERPRRCAFADGGVASGARQRALEERDALQKTIAAAGGNFRLAAWDWRYYAEKVRKAKFDIERPCIKPYLQLENVIAAAFHVAQRLFGIVASERKDLALYHPDARAFEIKDAAGRHLGLFVGDYYARPSKRSGAWMSSWREQHRLDGEVRPLVVNVMNFAKGAAGEPTLLSSDDARTLFHEFGHALHALLSNVTYPSVSGTSVERDFVELPSQLYEHWLLQPEVLLPLCPPLQDGKADLLLPDQALEGGTQLQSRFSDDRIPGAGASSTSSCMCCKKARAWNVDSFERQTLGEHRHARRDRHAPPHPTFPAHHRRLRGGLLQLPVVRGDGCRCLRSLRGHR